MDEVPLHIYDYLLYEYADREKLPATIYTMIMKELKDSGKGESEAGRTICVYMRYYILNTRCFCHSHPTPTCSQIWRV